MEDDSLVMELIDVLLKLDQNGIERLRKYVNGDKRFSLWDKLIVDRMIHEIYVIQNWESNY